jgi:hypothetical protein
VTPTNTQLILDEIKNLGLNVAVLNTRMETMQVSVDEASRAIKGNNGNLGLVGKFENFKLEVANEFSDFKETLETLKNRDTQELACRTEFLEVKRVTEEYPSITWLIHHKPKTILTVLASIVVISVVLFSPLVDSSVAAALLTWMGVPGGIITLVK